ncbi:hypothetical protein [Burkholderia seminalis]|uniref:hypothetical protein n=1 Tax=Burkholderia seminalis TaxID=488731 RepID=UPI0031DA4DC1
MQTLERNELYELVWQMPMIELGKRYGVSRDAIRWACIQLNVPLPPQGYWGALAAGKVMERPALPPLQANKVTTLSVAALIEKDAPRSRRRSQSMHKPSLVERLFGAKQPKPEDQVVLLPHGYKWHRSVQSIKEDLDAAAADAIVAKKRFEWLEAHPGKRYPYRDETRTSWKYFSSKGEVLAPGHGLYAVRLTLRTYERGLVILNDVMLKAVDAGFTVRKGGIKSIELYRDGACVNLRLVERLLSRTVDRINTYTKKVEQDRVLVSSGNLEFLIEQQGHGKSTFRDGDRGKLEQLIPAIIEAIELRHARSKEQIAEWARDEQRRKEDELLRQQEEKRRIAELKRAEEEKQRREALVREAQLWQQAEVLRFYLAELDRRLSAGGEPTNGYKAWRQWAEEVAHDLDMAALRIKMPRP